MTVYDRIRETRKLRGMSQTELAEKSGYADKSMISRIENGKVEIFVSNLLKIAEAMNVDPLYLMGRSEDAKLEDLAELFSQLNTEGQEKVYEYANDLVLSGAYKKHGESEMVDEA